jgi:hypothetical protein
MENKLISNRFASRLDPFVVKELSKFRSEMNVTDLELGINDLFATMSGYEFDTIFIDKMTREQGWIVHDRYPYLSKFKPGYKPMNLDGVRALVKFNIQELKMEFIQRVNNETELMITFYAGDQPILVIAEKKDLVVELNIEEVKVLVQALEKVESIVFPF